MALYDVVVADARAPRDGRFIEKIGRYNPNTDPASVDLNEEKAFDWVMKGAQPTDTVRAMLSYRGIMLKKHLQIGVNKGAISQEDADKKFEAWKAEKEVKIQEKRERILEEASASVQARKEAETKVKEARAEALKKKAEAAEVEAAGETAEAAGEAPAAEAGEEVPQAETSAEEESAASPEEAEEKKD